jgi:NAD(P)-dependent dehydrogenase (short-subunit alcohol dehydrogenase family)
MSGPDGAMRVVVTGCSSGLGLLTAHRLIEAGHEVVPHVRSASAAEDLRSALPGASTALVAELTQQAEVENLAESIRELGADVLVHNAALGDQLPSRTVTAGRSDLFAVNVVAPYLLTALIPDIPRAIFISSALHREATLELDDPSWAGRPWQSRAAYAESKLLVTVLAAATARLRPGTEVNSVEPGWVPTRMGGSSAPDDLEQGVATQLWLATAPASELCARTGGHWYHLAPAPRATVAIDRGVQDDVVALLRAETGVGLSAPSTDRRLVPTPTSSQVGEE